MQKNTDDHRDHDMLSVTLVRLSQRLEAIAGRFVYEPLGISFSAGSILWKLADYGPATATQLLTRVGGGKSNLSQRLRWLLARGYVTRTACADGREWLIALTPQGTALVATFRERLLHANHALEQYFSAAERADFQRLIKKTHATLDGISDADLSLLFPHSS